MPVDQSWFTIAKAELGVKEVPGSGSNPRIIEYDTATDLKATSDQVAWCSSFANWCLKQAGFVGTNDAMARSFLRMPAQLMRPVEGCICVLWRGSPKGDEGHVGFLVKWDPYHVWILGGNQSDSVSIEAFDKDRVLGYFWPTIRSF